MMKTRKTLTTLALASVMAVFVGPTPATYAASPGGGSYDCTVSQTQTGAAATCTNNGNGATSGGSGYIAPLAGWIAIGPHEGDCVDKNGVASFMTQFQNVDTGEIINGPQPYPDGSTPYPHPCYNQGQAGLGTVNQVDLQAQAKALVIQATPTANYQGNFLTGAAVTFSVQTGSNLITQAVPNVAGAVITASPAGNFKWDFGDGNTGTSSPGTSASAMSTVDHIYQSTTPDPTNTSNHKVTVTVSRTWNVYFNQANADQNATTFQITVTSTLNPDRTIVQVFSAQTEPNS